MLSPDPVVTAHLVSLCYFLISLSGKKNKGTLEKWLILGLGQELYNISLEHLVVPVRKCLKKKKKRTNFPCKRITINIWKYCKLRRGGT